MTKRQTTKNVTNVDTRGTRTSRSVQQLAENVTIVRKWVTLLRYARKKSIKTVTENPGVVSDSTDTDSDYDLIAYIRDAGIQHKEPKLLGIKVNGFPLSWEADTGATRDLMSEEQFQDYERQIGHRICLSPTRTKLFAFGSSKSLTILGHFKAQLRAGAKAICSTIVVTKEPSNYPLLSRSTLEQLSLVRYNQRFVVKGPKQYSNASSWNASKSRMVRGKSSRVNRYPILVASIIY